MGTAEPERKFSPYSTMGGHPSITHGNAFHLERSANTHMGVQKLEMNVLQNYTSPYNTQSTLFSILFYFMFFKCWSQPTVRVVTSQGQGPCRDQAQAFRLFIAIFSLESHNTKLEFGPVTVAQA